MSTFGRGGSSYFETRFLRVSSNRLEINSSSFSPFSRLKNPQIRIHSFIVYKSRTYKGTQQNISGHSRTFKYITNLTTKPHYLPPFDI